MDIEGITALIDSGDDAGALGHLLALVEREPAAEGAWLFLVGIGFRTNDPHLTLRAFRALEVFRPRDAFVASGLVDCLLQLKQYEEARRVINAFAEVAQAGNAVHETVLKEHRKALAFIDDRVSENIKGSDGS
ncbi:hypothetical protein [Stenotrophomonas sp. TD3]|uniref:hypothetical protein n=1 Tax=Stenotrophomonas sp. TD3 TaxID=1641707 RepID=UPI000951D6DC|nr:hypothetical protein [Stenotrophomonas sp. TD3]